MKNEKIIKEKKYNKFRSKTFGFVINPLLKSDQSVDWRSFSKEDISIKLRELNFPNKFDLMEVLNSLEFNNVHENKTAIEDFEGQFEFGSETNIPHYQLAIKTKSICTKKPILEALNAVLEAHINIDIQLDFENMKNYCSKDSEFLSEEYSGRIFKHQWKLNFIERKPELKQVVENPYLWQRFFLDNILSSKPDSRIVDWIVDPVGNTGKSSFARAYVSQEPTDGILMKIDNLDRMEFSIIYKITNYRDRYSKDPRIIFFDFPRAVDQKKVMAATALMEDIKSGHLETSFGGKHREVQISNVHIVVLANSAPDLSVLSVDRWRIWKLGGQEYNNIMWPCKPVPILKKYSPSTKCARWTVFLDNISPYKLENMYQYKYLNINTDWIIQKSINDVEFPIFASKEQYTKDIVSSIYDSPNDLKLLIFDFLEKEGKLIDFEKGLPV